jgi:hypothetical protein
MRFLEFMTGASYSVSYWLTTALWPSGSQERGMRALALDAASAMRNNPITGGSKLPNMIGQEPKRSRRHCRA